MKNPDHETTMEMCATGVLSDDYLNVFAKVSEQPASLAALTPLTSEHQAAIAKTRPRTRGKAFSSLPGFDLEV